MRIGICGLCLASLLAMGGVVAASASAELPEFSPAEHCTGKKTVKCHVIKIKSKEKTTVFEIAPSTQVVCRSADDKGEIIGANRNTEEMKFSACRLMPGNIACVAVGGVRPLESSIGYVNRFVPEVGVELVPKAPNLYFVEFNCGGTVIQVGGSLVGIITPLNTPTNQFKVAFTHAGLVQIPLNLEGGPYDAPLCSINHGSAMECGFESMDEVRTSSIIEIKA